MFIEDSPPAYEILRAVRIEIERVEVIHFVINETPQGDRPVETVFPAALVRSEVDVLPLRAGRRERIATASVPPGGYSLRIYLSGGEVETTAQTYSTDNGQLTLGGGTDAGSGARRYVVTRTFEQRVFARDGETKGVIVDMDLEESLVAQGDPGRPTRIDLVPVLRLRDTFAGGLRGVVRSDSGTPDDTSDDVPVENARVFLLQEGPNSESPDFTGVTRTNAQGAYVLQGVSGGSAVFTLIVSAPGHEDHGSPSDLEEPRGTFVTHDVLLRVRPPGPDPDLRTATLDVYLEDAPPSYEALRAVNVEIERVEAVHVQVDAPPDGTGRETETVFPLVVTSREVDVLPLRAGRRARIASGAVKAGEYYLRLYLSGGEVVTTTQTYSTDNGQLTLGGGSDAGSGVRQYVVKATYGRRVVAPDGRTQGVIVDMDLEESLVAQGDPERPTRIDLVPVLRLRDTYAGGLRGVVRSDAGTPDDTSDDGPVENAHVRLMQEGPNSEGPDFTGVTRTDAQGVYVLQGVSGGSAVFTLIVSAPGHDDHLSPSDLEEPRGDFVTHDVLLRRTSN